MLLISKNHNIRLNKLFYYYYFYVFHCYDLFLLHIKTLKVKNKSSKVIMHLCLMSFVIILKLTTEIFFHFVAIPVHE